LDRIREFESRDIEQVAHLHRSVFKLDIEGPIERYYAYFSEHFLARDQDSLPSLVCETERGRILGFLGVAVRHFSFEGRKITAALSSQFVVHPEGRGRLTGIHLLREFLNGRQHLSFTDEANEVSQRIWVALGGSVSTMQGIHWMVPLRPVRLLLNRYVPLRTPATLMRAANVLDRLVSALPRSPFQNAGTSVLKAEPLSNETMLSCLNEVTRQCQIRPHYDCASLDALMERARHKTTLGSLRGVLLRDEENRVIGWYLYQCKPGGLAEVLQVASREYCHGHVVEHLTSDARAQGAIALVGRLEPGLAEPLANGLCLLFRRKYAMLVHSRFPEILCAIHSGRAFISRLEGEWCVRYA
jgi:L-amino acid N-acyltransferase YncA